jgi:hypothetical protein
MIMIIIIIITTTIQNCRNLMEIVDEGRKSRKPLHNADNTLELLN